MPTNANADAAVTQPRKHAEKQHESKGEKIHDLLVYTGLNYWGNLGMSLVIADYFTHLSGKKHLDKIIAVTERVLSNPKMLSNVAAHKTSKAIWETMALTSGGVIASLLTKPLEDNKRPIVHWLNKKLGVDQTAADGHEMTPDEIYLKKDQHTQSWWNVIKRRLFASVVIVGAGSALEHTVGMNNVKDTVISTVNNGLRSGLVPGGKSIAKSPVFQRYLGYAALDTFFSGVHAAIMKITYGDKKSSLQSNILTNEETPVAAEKMPEQPAAKSFVASLAEPQKNRDHFRKKNSMPMGNFTSMVSAAPQVHSLAT